MWIDGTRWFDGPATAVAGKDAYFGSKAVSQGGGVYTVGLTLFENLNYLKARFFTQNAIPWTSDGGGRVVTRTFDQEEPVYYPEHPVSGTVMTVPYKETVGDSTQVMVHDYDGSRMRLYLVGGRRLTGQVAEENADGYVNYEGDLVEYGEGLLPGVVGTIVGDAVGTTHLYSRGALDPSIPNTFCDDGAEDDELPEDGTYRNGCTTGGYGPDMAPPGSAAPAANVAPASDEPPPTTSPPAAGLTNTDTGNEQCACRQGNPSQPMLINRVETATGDWTNDNGGSITDRTLGGQRKGLGLDIAPGGGMAPEDQLCGFESWRPDAAYNGLSKAHQAVYDKLWQEGWKFASNDDGSKTINGLAGEESKVDVEVTDADWANRFAEGGDVQWVHDRWGVDFDNKVIYIDSGWDCWGGGSARAILSELAKEIIDQGGNIAETNFHASSWNKLIGWGELDDITKELLDIYTDRRDAAAMKVKRLAGQLGSHSLAALNMVAQAVSSHFSVEGAIIGAGAAVALAAAAKLVSVMLKLHGFVKIGQTGKLAKLTNGTSKGVKTVDSASDLRAIWRGLSKGKQVTKEKSKDGKTLDWFTDSSGRRIQYRSDSQSKGPTIDIFHGKLDGVRKVHVGQP